jgi:hypothetical protein
VLKAPGTSCEPAVAWWLCTLMRGLSRNVPLLLLFARCQNRELFASALPLAGPLSSHATTAHPLSAFSSSLRAPCTQTVFIGKGGGGAVQPPSVEGERKFKPIPHRISRALRSDVFSPRGIASSNLASSVFHRLQNDTLVTHPLTRAFASCASIVCSPRKIASSVFASFASIICLPSYKAAFTYSRMRLPQEWSPEVTFQQTPSSSYCCTQHQAQRGL